MKVKCSDSCPRAGILPRQRSGFVEVKSQIREFTKRVYENTQTMTVCWCRLERHRSRALFRTRSAPDRQSSTCSKSSKRTARTTRFCGDIPKGNGDAPLTVFGRKVTPNQHALAEQFVLFDNLYSMERLVWDEHSWSNSAYATDFK